MNTNSELTDDIEVVGPGQMLRDAREKKGWSQEDVARKLNLRAHNINDFENEEFDPKVAQTFTKGYLKSYAKLTGLYEQQVLDAYEHLGIAEAQYAEMQSFSQRTKNEAHDNRLMWMSYGIGAIILGLLVWWWWQKSAVNTELLEASRSEDIITVEEVDPVAPEYAELSVPEDDSLIISSALVDISSDTEELAVTDDVLPEDIPQEETTSAPAIESAIAESEGVAPTAESEVVVVQTTSSSLELSFTDDCWVKITDATGQTLAVGVKKAGYEMPLRGKAPFKIVLGAPQVVKIKYEGEAVDMSRFKAGRIARFELPEEV